MWRSPRIYLWVFLVLGMLVLALLWTHRDRLDSSIANVATNSWVPRPIQRLLTKMIRANPPVAPAWEVPEQRAIINAEIEKVAKENWQQSIENLMTNGNQFLETGYGSDSFLGAHEYQLEEVLGCRRAVKVLNILEKLPEKERVQRCKDLFDRTFRAMESKKIATKHSVCLALFATAETGRLDVLGAEFKQLDEYQKRVEKDTAGRDLVDEQFHYLNESQKKQVLANRKFFNDDFRERLIKGSMPQLRFQLNVIRLAASRNPQSSDLLKGIDAYCQSEKLITEELPVVAWNARTTRFDTRVGSRMDVSKGVTTYSFYNWGGARDSLDAYDQNREFVQKVRELAF